MTKPEPLTARWQEQDRAHFLHPFTDHQALGRRGTRVMVRADGVHVWDSEGHRMLDAMSGLWCVHMGYGQRALVDAACRQLEQLAFYNSFFEVSTPPAIELAARLAAVTPPQFRHVFFTGSGSESTDTAIRLVRRYWQLLGQPERHVIIARHNGYHGSTLAGSSLGGMAGMHQQGGLALQGIVHIQQPHWWHHGRPYGADPDSFGLMAAGLLEQVILAAGPEQVAAFIAEPVQGAGGVIVPPDTYWPEVQRICDKYGVLLISDEVVCGFGRTGRWFGCDTFGSRPDLITFAKGITSGYVPLGGVMVGERIARLLIERGGEFSHGFTYSGHPVACAVALANLQLMDELRIIDRVHTDIAPQFAAAINGLVGHPLAPAADTCGLMAGLQLDARALGDPSAASAWALAARVRAACLEAGVVVRASGDRIIVAPPLVSTTEHVREIARTLLGALELALAEGRSAAVSPIAPTPTQPA